MRHQDSNPATQQQLAAELDELSAQLQQIGARLRLLDDAQPGTAQVRLDPAERMPAEPAPARPLPPAEPAPAQPGVLHRLLAAIRSEGFSSRLIAWLGGAITLVGLVLALALAIQRGYLGPLPRVLGGLLLSGGLLLGALRLHRTPAARPGAYALAATGIAGVYLAVIAATALYGFLPDYAGLLVGFAVALGGLGLASKWNTQLLACFVVLGCVACAPLLTGGVTPVLAGFLLVLKAATAAVQLRRGWPGLGFAAALPALTATLLAGQLDQSAQPLLVTGLAVGAALLIGTVAVCTVRRETSAGLAMLVSAPVPGLLLAPSLPTGLGLTVLGVLIAALAGLWVFSRARPAALPAAFAALAGGLAALAVLQTSTMFVEGTARTVLLLVEAIGLALLAVRLRYRGALLTALIYAVAGWLFVLLAECRPSELVTLPSQPTATGLFTAGALAGATGAVATAILAWAGYRLGLLADPRHAPRPWGLVALGVLYGSASAVLNTVLLLAPGQTGFFTAHVLITLGWTITGLALLSRFPESMVLRLCGLMLAAAAVAKLVLFDLAALDGLARVAVALGAGLALLLVGARYSRGPRQSEEALLT